MRVEFHESAAAHERYARHAFDRTIGQEVPFKVAGVERGRATVIAVVVDEDGRGATWTVDVEGDAAQVIPGGEQGMSFSVPEIPERWWK